MVLANISLYYNESLQKKFVSLIFVPLLSHSQQQMKVSVKGRLHCFSMQVAMNKCFYLNPEKKFAQIRLVVSRKRKKKL